MVAGAGVTEIADSEEEPLTSSPAAVSDAAVDKLSVTARRDTQAASCSHQDATGHVANNLSSRTDCLNVDLDTPSTDLNITFTECSDMQLMQQAETNNNSTCATQAHLNADLLPAQNSPGITIVDQQCDRVDGQESCENGVLREAPLLHQSPPTTFDDNFEHDSAHASLEISERPASNKTLAEQVGYDAVHQASVCLT